MFCVDYSMHDKLEQTVETPNLIPIVEEGIQSDYADSEDLGSGSGDDDGEHSSRTFYSSFSRRSSSFGRHSPAEKELEKGMLFRGFQQLKYAIKSYSIYNGYGGIKFLPCGSLSIARDL